MDSIPRTAADLARHASAVRRVARALLADEAAAEDVSQEALRLALERPAITRGSLGGWLVGAARRLAGTRARTDARRRRREQAVAVAEAQPSASERAAGLEVAERMVALVRALPESQAEVIWLRYWEDLPPRAIARRLGLGVEAVKTRLKRGLASLRRDLDADTPGGRAAWLGALVPLWAAPPGAVLSVPSLSTANGLPLVFVLKKLALIALVAAVLGAGFLVFNGGRADPLSGAGLPSSEERASALGASGDRQAELAEPVESSERAPRGAAEASLARVLEARVVRAFDGAPLTGVVVAALERDRPKIESVGRSARSDEQGRVRFEDLRPGPVRLVADRGAWVEVDVGETGRTRVELVVELGVRVRGLVLDPGGQPVAGAAIVLQTGEPFLDWNQIAQVAVSGAGGRFELIDVALRSLIAARAAGYAPSDLDLLAHRALEPGDECEVTLHLVAGGGVARGVVLSPQGAPVFGAHVWVEDRGEPTAWRNTPRGSHLSTAHDGTFELGSLALGKANVVVAARGYAREVVRIPVTAEGGPHAPIHLHPPAGIDGRVLTADGRPQGGVTVRLARVGRRYAADYAPLGFRATVSDAEGRFHFDDLPPGEARVIARPRGHPALEQQGTLRAGERSNMELRTPSGLVLTGRALEPDGEPLTGVIILLDGGAGWRTQLQTEADGSFRFESVPEGPLTVYLYPARDGWSRPVVTREGVTAQDSPLLLVWDSAPEVGTVRGRFADPAGWVQAGDRVLAQLLQEDRFTQEILIDMPDGNFRFEGVLGDESYRVSIVARDQMILGSEVFRVQAGKEFELPELRTAEFATVRLAFLTGDSDVEVWGALTDSSRRLHRFMRSNKGLLADDRVPPGSWSFTLSARGFASEGFELDLQPGEVWEHNHTGVPVPTTHLRLEFPQPTTSYHVRIWRLDGTLCHESAVIGGLPRGFPVGLLPGGYRIEAVDRTRFWTGEGTFEIPPDDGSGTEREVAVALDPR